MSKVSVPVALRHFADRQLSDGILLDPRSRLAASCNGVALVITPFDADTDTAYDRPPVLVTEDLLGDNGNDIALSDCLAAPNDCFDYPNAHMIKRKPQHSVRLMIDVDEFCRLAQAIDSDHKNGSYLVLELPIAVRHADTGAAVGREVYVERDGDWVAVTPFETGLRSAAFFTDADTFFDDQPSPYDRMLRLGRELNDNLNRVPTV